jgi:hypothetical protein
MGFPSSHWLPKFVKNQTIKSIKANNSHSITLKFKNGESLRLYGHTNVGLRNEHGIPLKTELIVTPFRKDGTVKQTTEIES